MRKIAEQIVKKRILILVLATVLLVPSLIGYINTRINYDILSYLPDQLDSIEGQDILDQEFHSASMAIVTGSRTKSARSTASAMRCGWGISYRPCLRK